MAPRLAPLTLLFFFLSFIISFVNGSINRLERDDITGHVGSTREEILARREQRKIEFSNKLEQLKQQWEDHVSGKKRLKEGFETERLQKKIKAYETKLDHLNQEIDDRHIQRLLDREEMLNEVHRERILRRSEL